MMAETELAEIAVDIAAEIVADIAAEIVAADFAVDIDSVEQEVPASRLVVMRQSIPPRGRHTCSKPFRQKYHFHNLHIMPSRINQSYLREN
jgi:hypothetical protein